MDTLMLQRSWKIQLPGDDIAVKTWSPNVLPSVWGDTGVNKTTVLAVLWKYSVHNLARYIIPSDDGWCLPSVYFLYLNHYFIVCSPCFVRKHTVEQHASLEWVMVPCSLIDLHHPGFCTCDVCMSVKFPNDAFLRVQPVVKWCVPVLIFLILMQA
jgi:hypothetical protein